MRERATSALREQVGAVLRAARVFATAASSS
jgi:hypothetical protein